MPPKHDGLSLSFGVRRQFAFQRAMNPRYRVGRVLLTFGTASIPVLWILIFRRHSLPQPFPDYAYIVCSTFALCCVTYVITWPLPLHRAQGASPTMVRLSRLSRNLVTGVMFVLTLLGIGRLVPDEESFVGYVLLALYVIATVNLFFSEYLAQLYAPREAALPGFRFDASEPGSTTPPSYQTELLAAGRVNAAIRFAGLPAAFSLIGTFMTFFSFNYEDTIPNHATLFAAIYGVSIVLYSQLQSDSRNT